MPRFADPPAPTPELLAAARAEAPADLLLAGARVVNVFTLDIEPAHVAIVGDRIARVSPERCEAKETVDFAGMILAPGFIDAHVHIESTMRPPSLFAPIAVARGNTGCVADPHEIANVLGVAGIEWMMRDAERAPMNIMWGASSCVPSCHLENSGATVTAEDLAPLFASDRVVALAEMMNFPGVVHADPNVLEKIALGLRERLVDGHAPGVRGDWLQAYAASGISSDHESTTADEAREKLAAGLRVFIREGSASHNLEALLPIVTERTFRRICFCTDDRHLSDLVDDGQIDHVVRKAIALGLDPAMAIAMGSFNTAEHFRLPARGAIAPGYIADLVAYDNLHELRARRVWFEGTLVAQDGDYLGEQPSTLDPPPSGVTLPSDLDESALQLDPIAPGASIRVIGMDPTSLVTEHLTMPASTNEAGRPVADPARDILKITVIERHRGTGNIGLGFVRGFRFSGGAIASTVGHDAHNLAVVGDNDHDMLVAARALADAGGGQCVVKSGIVQALLPLEIAGLMTSAPDALERQRALLDAARALGCPHHDPFMPLSFLPLPVIPSLKISDLGLVDVEKFEVVGLLAEG